MNASTKTSTGMRNRLRPLPWLVALWVGLSVGGGPGLAQNTNAPARLTYDSFRMISDRNIFNPSRYARGTSRPPTTRTTSRSPARVESFSLVGIMAYEKGTFAFFDGTSSDYKQALQSGAQIGEYTLTRVTPDAVQLTTGTNAFELKVGMQLRREDEGDWFLTEGTESSSRRVVVSRSRTRSTGARDGTTAGGEGFMENGEPEILVVDGEMVNEVVGEEPPPALANGNDEAARAETNSEANGTTDPVLLRLMQRRQQMNQ